MSFSAFATAFTTAFTTQRFFRCLLISSVIVSSIAGCETETAKVRTTAKTSGSVPEINSPEEKSIEKTEEEWNRILKNFVFENKENHKLIPRLIALVQNDSLKWHTRKQAALTLARIGTPAKNAIPVLLHLMASDTPNKKQESESTRLWAAKAIAQFGPIAKEATPLLRKQLRKEATPFVVRLACLDAISRIGAAHAESLPALIETLQSPIGGTVDEQQSLRQAALLGMLNMKHHAAPATPTLILALEDEHELIREYAAQTLEAIGSPAETAASVLAERVLIDSSQNVREKSAAALWKLGDAATPFLKNLLTDKELSTRKITLEALARQKQLSIPDEIKPILIKQINDVNDAIRMAAVESFLSSVKKVSKNTKTAIVPACIKLLESKDRNIRVRAIHAIKRIPQKEISPYLSQLNLLLKSTRPEVRAAAKQVLKSIP